MSSMVVFQYKAVPVSPSGSIAQTGGEEDASDQDEEQGTLR